MIRLCGSESGTCAPVTMPTERNSHISRIGNCVLCDGCIQTFEFKYQQACILNQKVRLSLDFLELHYFEGIERISCCCQGIQALKLLEPSEMALWAPKAMDNTNKQYMVFAMEEKDRKQLSFGQG